MDSDMPIQTNDDAQESIKREWLTPQLTQIEMDDTESGACTFTFEAAPCLCAVSF